MDTPVDRTPEKVAERLAKAVIERHARTSIGPASLLKHKDRIIGAMHRSLDEKAAVSVITDMIDEGIIADIKEIAINEKECQKEYDAMTGEERTLAKLYMGEVRYWWRKKINDLW